MNGNVPGSQLVTIDAFGTRLATPTANMWGRLVADAAAAGHYIRVTVDRAAYVALGEGIGGYRSVHVQRWLRANPIGPAPIAPVGASSHGLGNTIDISCSPAAMAWIVANAQHYGIRRTIKSEPWHWVHDGITAASSGSVTPIEKDDMFNQEDRDKLAYLANRMKDSVVNTLGTLNKRSADNESWMSGTVAPSLEKVLALLIAQNKQLAELKDRPVAVVDPEQLASELAAVLGPRGLDAQAVQLVVADAITAARIVIPDTPEN